jgi:hypothetical protein
MCSVGSAALPARAGVSEPAATAAAKAAISVQPRKCRAYHMSCLLELYDTGDATSSSQPQLAATSITNTYGFDMSLWDLHPLCHVVLRERFEHGRLIYA